MCKTNNLQSQLTLSCQTAAENVPIISESVRTVYISHLENDAQAPTRPCMGTGVAAPVQGVPASL